MLASDLAKNSESFSPGGDVQQNHLDDNESTAANVAQAESHVSNEVDHEIEYFFVFSYLKKSL